MIAALLLLATCFLACSNGANDNFKGVASIYGSGTASYKAAITWATAATLAGSIASIFLAEALLKKFSGKGLVPNTLVASEYFLLAMAVSAGATVLLATRLGFPISTTHGLIGALIGAGYAAGGLHSVNLSSLGRSFVLPLLLSPVLAVALGAGLYTVFHCLRWALGLPKEWCVCVGNEERLVPISRGDSMLRMQALPLPVLVVATTDVKSCKQRYAGTVAGIDAQRLVDVAHFASAGVVSFARGLNDTPKIAALLLLLKWLRPGSDIALTGFAIALGGLLGARRVAETMSHKITTINHGQGLASNLATGILVMLASTQGLPVSTTHVAVGTLFGIGLTTGQANVKTMASIALSWIVTLPCAAALGGITYWALAHAR